jgi:hypothetical protein
MLHVLTSLPIIIIFENWILARKICELYKLKVVYKKKKKLKLN